MRLAKNPVTEEVGGEEQRGINMVDLMMWLVIAALLLAAAIQGIGYYQQAANVYQMKEAVSVAQSRIMAVAANDGSIDVEDVDTVVAEENAERNSDNVTLSVGTIALTAAGEAGNDSGFELASFATATTVASGETYYIRAVHTGVTKYDVIHMFKDTASKKQGTHLVDKGTTGPATPGGGTPEPTPSASPSPSATATPTPTPSATPTPTPTPTPTATRPADSNAAGTIVQASGYSAWWGDRSVQSMSSNAGATFGFAVSGVTTSTTPSTSNFTVEFSGSPEIGVKATQATQFMTTNGGIWYATILPETGGFKEGIGYVTAKVTNNTTGAVSMKSWQLTVTAHTGMTQPGATGGVSAYWTDKTVNGMTSGTNAIFGFEIKNAASTDYDVVFSGGQGVGVGSSATNFRSDYGQIWYSVVTPVAGGFTVGSDTVTATATHKVTGKKFTKTYTLTAVEHPGMTQPGATGGVSAYWTDKTASNLTSGATAIFGFEIKGGAATDFDVVFSGGQGVGVGSSATNYRNDYGNIWYSVVTPVAGGFTLGSDTITATAKHKLTGKVYTKTYTLTIVEHAGMTPGSYSTATHWSDKTATIGSTAGKVFGFRIPNAKSTDFDVTFSMAGEVNAVVGATNFSGDYGADWFTVVSPKTGGFSAGTATITATATHKLTGKVFTKTYTLTVN